MPLINVKVPNEIKAAADKREAALNTIAALPLEDLDRLRQIAEKPKALKSLKDKWGMLKMMF